MVAKNTSFYNALRIAYNEYTSGKLILKDPNPPRSFINYVLRLDYSLWFWTILSLILITVASIYLTPVLPYLKYLRYLVGTLYVLFIPGYVLIEALYPEEKSLSPLERVALSIGLSLAIIPLIGLLLNYTPWGIRLGPIVSSTLVYSIALLLVAAYRKYSLLKLRLKAS